MMTLKDEQDQQLSGRDSENAKKDQQPDEIKDSQQDQSKKQRTTIEDNPNHIENPDDLHEIQVDDDLDEPDVEALQPGKKGDIDKALPGDLVDGAP
jgi:hypothetical protein